MSDNPKLDDELAAYTDRVLGGETAPAPDPIDDLSSVVRQLYDVIAPDSGPDEAFRTRLTQRLNQEWNLKYQRQPRWWHNRRVQIVAMAASMAVVLSAIALILAQDKDNGDTLQGTAWGSTTETLLAMVAVVVVVGLLFFWLRYRRNRPKSG
jgi:hypothetical protein